MPWEVVLTDECRDWYRSLTEAEQDSVDPKVDLLVQHGPMLGYPSTSDIHSSHFGQMRELRIQHAGRPYRILYAFDPKRQAVLLIGGDKTGNSRWYEEFVPKADAIFSRYLTEEGLA